MSTGLWLVRSFDPGKREQPFEEQPYESEIAALEDYQDRAATVAENGGGCELITPSGCVQAHISKPVGRG